MPAHHEVIQHFHVDELQTALERLREQFVSARRLQHARRVVVRQDDAGGIVLQRALDHLPRVNKRVAL